MHWGTRPPHGSQTPAIEWFVPCHVVQDSMPLLLNPHLGHPTCRHKYRQHQASANSYEDHLSKRSPRWGKSCSAGGQTSFAVAPRVSLWAIRFRHRDSIALIIAWIFFITFLLLFIAVHLISGCCCKCRTLPLISSHGQQLLANGMFGGKAVFNVSLKKAPGSECHASSDLSGGACTSL